MGKEPQSRDTSTSDKSSPAITWIKITWLASKRFLAIFGALLAVYVAVGSALFGTWWYGFVWEANWSSWRYIRKGLFFLFDNHFAATIASICGMFILAAVIRHYVSRPFLRVVDRLWGWIFVASLVALCLTAIVDRHYFQADYSESDFLDDDQPAIAASRRLGQPELVAPIEFKFLDEQQITALYSQIIPEYVGKERSVEESGSASAKAGISAGSLNAEVNKQSGSEIKSTEQRVEFTLQRKAIDTINFCVHQGTCDFYTTAEDWLLYRELEGQQQRTERMIALLGQGGSRSKELKSLADPNSEEYLEAKSKRQADNLRSLEAHLSHYAGFLVIDGEYSIRNTGKELILTHLFVNKPRPIRFAVSVPTLAYLDHLGQKSFFRVFASVDQSLQKDGVISLHALAIY